MCGTLLGLMLAGTTLAAGDAKDASLGADEAILKKASVPTEGDALLAFFRKRTLPESERPAILQQIRQLGSEDSSERETASAALIQRGPAVVELLRAALADPDLEIARRADRCLAQLRDNDVSRGVPAAALRVLAAHKPAGASATILAFLPFADDDATADEARTVLRKLALVDGKADPVLVAALADRAPIRRAASGAALARAGAADRVPEVRKLLSDADAEVRYRVGQALAYAGDPKGVAALIDSLSDLPLPLAWQAEDFLLRAAGAAAPPVSLGNDPATRRKCRDSWQAWWTGHAAKVDLTKLEEPAKLLGNTMVVLLDFGRVMELGPQNQKRWEINNLSFPLDVQLLGEDRVLVAEYYGNRVTVRDLKGNVEWERDVTGPLAAQRLRNGNTFVTTDTALFEFDKDGKEVLKIDMPGEQKRVMKALKLPNGEIACLTSDARVSRLDAQGKELHGFTVTLATRLFGGRIHMLPSGRVLVPHHAENKVAEYDSQGKIVWEVAVEKPVSALRLPNGNTLVTSMEPYVGAVEFDRAGREVWHFNTTTRVTRAIRR
jgi:hypothetical protein